MKEVLIAIGFNIFSFFLVLMVVTLLIGAVSSVAKTIAILFYGVQSFSISTGLTAFVLSGITKVFPSIKPTADPIILIISFIIGILATKMMVKVMNMNSFHSKIVVKHIMNASFIILDTWLFYNFIAKRFFKPQTVWMNIISFFVCIVISYLVNKQANLGLDMRKDA